LRIKTKPTNYDQSNAICHNHQSNYQKNHLNIWRSHIFRRQCKFSPTYHVTNMQEEYIFKESYP